MKFYSNEENGIALNDNELRISYSFGQLCYFKVDQNNKMNYIKN